MIDYPIRFVPILKEKIWGGDRLSQILDKHSTKNNIGESWEISDVDGESSIVANGRLKGKTLSEILKQYKEELIGCQVYKKTKDKFPLLIKFIDAKKPLSIQVHPNDQLALKRHNSFGKTEMWYVINAETHGNLIVGFKKNIGREEYLKHLKRNTLKEILNINKVSEGDVYFIPAGRVHAIGSGVLLAEIQQTSDITYRIFDWNRVNKENGKSRALHTNLALDAMNYKADESYKTTYTSKLNEPVRLITCEYFTVNQLIIKETYTAYDNKDSFIIYMCIKGNCNIVYGANHEESLEIGQTILIPACLKKYFIKVQNEVTLLEVYI